MQGGPIGPFVVSLLEETLITDLISSTYLRYANSDFTLGNNEIYMTSEENNIGKRRPMKSLALAMRRQGPVSPEIADLKSLGDWVKG